MGMEIFYNKEMYILLRIEHLIKLNLIMGLLRLEKLWYFCFFFFYIITGRCSFAFKKKNLRLNLQVVFLSFYVLTKNSGNAGT